MSIISYILGSTLFQNLFSFSVWLLILGIPLLVVTTFFYCAAKGTGNLTGLVVDKTAKRVRGYQQQQRKRDKRDPPIERVNV